MTRTAFPIPEGKSGDPGPVRSSRYRGPAKTSLQHQLTGAAINLARIDSHLAGTPRARTHTRTRHFAALGPAGHMLSGAE